MRAATQPHIFLIRPVFCYHTTYFHLQLLCKTIDNYVNRHLLTTLSEAMGVYNIWTSASTKLNPLQFM